jgi:hypothetical protein
MEEQGDTKDITNYIKGIAIIIVLIEHYFGVYLRDDYDEFIGFANGIISLFYALSGYGLFISSKNLFLNKGVERYTLFFFKRFMRVLPSYYVLFLPKLIWQAHFNWMMVFLPFIFQPYTIRFVAYILQCYFLAPLLLILLVRVGLFRYLIVFAIILLISLITPTISGIEYRLVNFGHIFFFAFGLATPMLLSKSAGRLKHYYIRLVAIMIFLLSVNYTRLDYVLFAHSQKIAFILLLISSIVIIMNMIESYPTLYMKKIIILFGVNSYPLLLLNLTFYSILFKCGLISHNNLKSFFVAMLLIPALLLVCIYCEIMAKKFTLAVQKVVFPNA